jgi:hypothetical protein
LGAVFLEKILNLKNFFAPVIALKKTVHRLPYFDKICNFKGYFAIN